MTPPRPQRPKAAACTPKRAQEGCNAKTPCRRKSAHIGRGKAPTPNGRNIYAASARYAHDGARDHPPSKVTCAKSHKTELVHTCTNATPPSLNQDCLRTPQIPPNCVKRHLPHDLRHQPMDIEQPIDKKHCTASGLWTPPTPVAERRPHNTKSESARHVRSSFASTGAPQSAQRTLETKTLAIATLTDEAQPYGMPAKPGCERYAPIPQADRSQPMRRCEEHGLVGPRSTISKAAQAVQKAAEPVALTTQNREQCCALTTLGKTPYKRQAFTTPAFACFGGHAQLRKAHSTATQSTLGAKAAPTLWKDSPANALGLRLRLQVDYCPVGVLRTLTLEVAYQIVGVGVPLTLTRALDY